MKGPNAICPRSGASLDDEERHHDERGRPEREPRDDHHDGPTSAELTNGERCSSRLALMNHWRRSLETHVAPEDIDDTFVQRAALALRRLKSASDARDEWIWYALCERLHRLDHDVGWMRVHAEPVCPYCGSRLKWELAGCDEPRPKCGVNCRDNSNYVLGEIGDCIRVAYTDAFDAEEIPNNSHLHILDL